MRGDAEKDCCVGEVLTCLFGSCVSWHTVDSTNMSHSPNVRTIICDISYCSFLFPLVFSSSFFLLPFLNKSYDVILPMILKTLLSRKDECVDVAYLCAHKWTTAMIDMLEDEVALETQKYKMPCIHSQMENTHSIYSVFVLQLVHFLSFPPITFYPAISHPICPDISIDPLFVWHLADLSPYFIIPGLSHSCTLSPLCTPTPSPLCTHLFTLSLYFKGLTEHI